MRKRDQRKEKGALVKGGFYFVPGLENHITNYQRIRWKVKRAPWCLSERNIERKREERERLAERNVITSCSTMNEDAI